MRSVEPQAPRSPWPPGVAVRLAREVSGLLVEYGVPVPVETRQELEERFRGILHEAVGGAP